MAYWRPSREPRRGCREWQSIAEYCHGLLDGDEPSKFSKEREAGEERVGWRAVGWGWVMVANRKRGNGREYFKKLWDRKGGVAGGVRSSRTKSNGQILQLYCNNATFI